MREAVPPATARDAHAVGRRRPQTTTWLALLLPVFAWAALTYPGYFELHSGFRPLFNLADLARSLPGFGWAPIVGQPYDLLRGEGALAYWLALLPRGVSASSVFGVKWVFGASFVLGAAGVYAWARRSLGDWPALLACVIYALWPIGLATVYVRGALAEALFMALAPWLLWAAAIAVETGCSRAAFLLAVGLAAAFWTQSGLALWLAVVVLAFLLYRGGARITAGESRAGAGRGGAGLAASLAGWLAGVALGIAGLLPVIARYGAAGKTYVAFTDHFVYPHQLLQAGWGVGPSLTGPYDALTLQLGIAACGLAVIGVVLADGPGTKEESTDQPAGESAYGRTDEAMAEKASASAVSHPSGGSTPGSRPAHRFPLAVVLILVFLSSTLAAPIWRSAPFPARTLTYPWQLLLLAGPWLAWLAGLGGRALADLFPAAQREAATPSLFAALLALALLGSYGYLIPATVSSPAPDAPLAIFGDNEIALLEAAPARAGGAEADGADAGVDVRWQALRPLARDYTVFLHAIGPDGQMVGQHDTMPRDNALPTSQWRPGQVVDDRYRAALKPGAPRDETRYNLGLYEWQTGKRLLTATDDKVAVQP